eukprot:589961-Pleurochrysis_carterae.AAC.1
MTNTNDATVIFATISTVISTFYRVCHHRRPESVLCWSPLCFLANNGRRYDALVLTPSFAESVLHAFHESSTVFPPVDDFGHRECSGEGSLTSKRRSGTDRVRACDLKLLGQPAAGQISSVIRPDSQE